MSEFKGTKGKWLVGDAEMKDTGINELVIYPENINNYPGGYRVICCISPMKRMDNEDLANARIMAKAPEMLEMLKEVLAGRIRPREYQSEWDMVNELIKSATEVK